MTPHFHRVMLDGNRPCPDVLRGLAVGILSVAALLTAEVKADPVGRRDMATDTTSTACVFRTDDLSFNSKSLCFVPYLKSGLGVRPPVNFGPEVLSFAQRTVSDVRQVFHDNTPCSNFNRVANQCFRSDMQEMSRYGSFVTTHASQETPGRPSTNGLNSSASAPDARTAVIQHPAMKEKCFGVCAVGSDQHPLDPHVNAHNAALLLRVWDFNLVGEKQIPLLANPLELRIFPVFWQRAWIVDHKQLTPKGDSFFRPIEITLPNYRHYRTREFCKFPFACGLGCLVSGTDNFAEGTRKLGWEVHPTQACVMSLGQTVGVKFLGIKHNFGNPISRFQPNAEHLVSFSAACNLDFGCSNNFHYTVTTNPICENL